MDNKYIFPLYEENDFDDAVEYLKKTIADSAGIAAMVADEEGDMQQVPLSQMPKQILDGILGGIVTATFGVNCPLMANYNKVQEIWETRFVGHILKYLDLKGFNSQNVSIDMKQITADAIRSMFMRNPGRIPLSRWDPNVHWDTLEYSGDPIADLINPINTLYYTTISIKSKNPNKYIIADEFVDWICKYKLPIHIISKNKERITEVSITVLPSRSYHSLLKLTQLIHKYF